MKKAIATGLIGLIAFGGTAAIAAPSALAQDGTATVTQTQDGSVREHFGHGPGRHNSDADRAARTQLLMDVLGVSADQLTASRESGLTLANLATANGVAVQTVVDAMVSAANTNIDAKVADGTIDAARAAEIRSTLVDRVTARVNGERPERPAGFEGRGRFGGVNGERPERPAGFEGRGRFGGGAEATAPAGA